MLYRSARFSNRINFKSNPRRLRPRAFAMLKDVDDDGLSLGIRNVDPEEGDCVNVAICAGVGKLAETDVVGLGFTLEPKENPEEGFVVKDFPIPDDGDAYNQAKSNMAKLSLLVWGLEGVK